MYFNNISRFILDYGFSPKYTKAELKELPALLNLNESLMAIMEGTVKLIYNSHVNTAALIVATDQRLIITSRSYQAGKLNKQIDFTAITAYKLKTLRTIGSIEIDAYDTATSFWSYNINECQKFYSVTQEVLVKLAEQKPASANVAGYLHTLEV